MAIAVGVCPSRDQSRDRPQPGESGGGVASGEGMARVRRSVDPCARRTACGHLWRPARAPLRHESAGARCPPCGVGDRVRSRRRLVRP